MKSIWNQYWHECLAKLCGYGGGGTWNWEQQITEYPGPPSEKEECKGFKRTTEKQKKKQKMVSIEASQALDPGSIPGWRTLLFLL